MQNDGLVLVFKLAGGFMSKSGQTKLDDGTKNIYGNVIISLNLERYHEKVFIVIYHSKLIQAVLLACVLIIDIIIIFKNRQHLVFKIIGYIWNSFY